MPLIDAEKRRAYARKWYKANLEKKKAYAKKWSEMNPGKRRAITQRWLERNSGRARASVTAYVSSAKGRERVLWYSAKQRAAAKGLEFSLTKAWIQTRLATGRCEVTGLPFNWDGRRRDGAMNGAFSPSIDRRDVTKGYAASNCRVVIWALNCALGQWGDEVFATVAKAYAESEWLK